MKKALILLLVILPTLVVVAALLWTTGVFTKALRVEMVEVQLAPLNRSVDTNGKVEADRVIELHAPLAGTCRRSNVHEGSQLKAGQEILRIEDPELPSQLAAARSELAAAQLDLRDVQRGPVPEELNQAEADVTKAQLAAARAREIAKTNEWLLTQAAISRSEVEQSRHAVSEAEATLKAAQTRLGDIKKKYGDLDLSRARSRVAAAEARIRYLNESLESLVVRAPANGTIYELSVKDGTYLNTGDLIGRFADLSALRLRAYVDEPDIGKVSKGEKVLIRWDAHPLQVWKGEVTQLPAQVVALGARSVAEVLCSIDNPENDLMPNINVDVEIQGNAGPEVKSLPRGIVFPEGTKEFVWVIEGGKAVKHYIETGRSTSSRIEITAGLSLGDQVIDPGDTLITDGSKVRSVSR